jgi:hypothetical protein
MHLVGFSVAHPQFGGDGHRADSLGSKLSAFSRQPSAKASVLTADR